MADGAAEMSPEALLEGGVILRAAEKVADQLAENGVALEELHHAGGGGTAQKRAAIETAHDARSEFQFTGESGFDPGRIFFRATLREGTAEQLSRAHGVKKTFAGERINPGGGVSYQGPILADYAAMGKSALLRRREHVAIEFCGGGGNFLRIDEGVQIRAEFRAGVGSHTAADADGEMIVARKRPDVAFEIAQKFNGDGVGGLRNEIALGHFQLVGLEGAGLGEKLIFCATSENQEVGGTPLAIDAIAWFVGGSVDIEDTRAMNDAAGFRGAIEEKTIQNGA